jgi:microcystin-dependent protein
MGTPYLSEIKIVAFNFPPKGWALCNGQLLPINQNQALFSLLGTTYGGDGRVNFALPDLRGRVAMHEGDGHILGEKGGSETVTLNQSQMPAHIHFLMADATTAATSNSGTPAANTCLGQTIGSPAQGSAFPVSLYDANVAGTFNTLAPQTLGPTGGSQPHQNMQPYLTLNFVIALQGVFPSRN